MGVVRNKELDGSKKKKKGVYMFSPCNFTLGYLAKKIVHKGKNTFIKLFSYNINFFCKKFQYRLKAFHSWKMIRLF